MRDNMITSETDLKKNYILDRAVYKKQISVQYVILFNSGSTLTK